MDLPASLRFSRYASAMLEGHPDEHDRLAATLDAPFPWAIEELGLTSLVDAGNPAALAAGLRRLRRRQYLHAMARDLSGRADLAEVCAGATHLAEVTLRAAVALHHRDLTTQYGEPRGEDGRAQQLIAIGMGKLGGGELNVSSDIDLVFVYPAEGTTDGARRLSNREFFEHLGRRIIAALNDVTADGYVFRVDMRLRPYGDSGPLAVPFAALEQYLITQGRAWERYAWLKARPLTGGAQEELAEIVTPFVFRKYLDFDAFDGLRDIQRQIREQGRRRDYEPNIKLGPGGIREMEFTVQALQLVRGGREPTLRERGTLPALAALSARGLLPFSVASTLRESYVFLRQLEHRLQYRDDQQTQTLPPPGAERDALAVAMDFGSAAAFDAALAEHRDTIAAQFGAVFGEPAVAPDASPTTSATAGGEDALATFAALWRDALPADAAEATVAAAGFDDPAALIATLARVRHSRRYLQLPALSQQRFDSLMPRLLAAAATDGHADSAGSATRGAVPQAVFMRLLALLEAVSRRSAYLALMIEHPPLLPRLAQLMGASAWAAEYLTRHPILLDELLDARSLLTEPDWSAWQAELERALAAQAADAEGRMDALRHVQHAQTFRLLAQDLAGTLTVERLADHLSTLADRIIAATLREVWRQLRGADAPAPPFAVIGYGKLGGKELGYASDLDLVFLYDDPDDSAVEQYVRLAQRMVTWLTSTTAAGALYDTDLRLRPDGAAGLMVSSLRAFRRYQQEHAWTWEHQALTRARFVTGDALIGAAFEAERERVLCEERDPASLREEVIEMRRKMHAGHPNPSALFDLKHDRGGMVDVEFAVQYLVLAHAHRHPALTRNAGNIALLALASELGLLPAAIATNAAAAYRDYRRRQHQLRLTGAPHARVDATLAAPARAAVTALWRTVLGTAWE